MSNPANKQPVIPESELRISKTSILMVVALIVFSLLIVTYARITDTGTFKTGGADMEQIGTLAYAPADGGFELAGDDVAFSVDEMAYAQGAVRSLERMNGGPLPEGTRFNVLQVRGGLVFLERIDTGDQISLDAFSRAKTQAFAAKLKATQTGGTNDGS